MHLASEYIIQTVGTVWEAMLALPVEPAEHDASVRASADVAAAVHITGPWTGSVVLSCDVETARVAAAVMFGTDPATAAPADLYDAVAELANMVGGNLKGLMPEGCQLSLPEPVRLPAPGASPAQSVPFTCLARPCRVDVYEQADSPAAAAPVTAAA